MAYTTSDEIVADFKDTTFGATDNVTGDDVDQFIVEADALIDSYVGSVYVIPVAAGAGLNLLKMLSRSLVAARIKRIMEVKQEKNADPNQNIVGVLLSPSQVTNILIGIQKRTMVLDGATPLVSGGGFYSSNVACNVQPVIKKDDKQW